MGISTYIFLTAFSITVHADEPTFESIQNLIREGKASEAIFLLDKVPKKVKAADPSAEFIFETQAELRKNNAPEALKKYQQARELFNQSVKEKKTTFFGESDIATLKRVIDLRLDHTEYLKQPTFTKKEATIAAYRHLTPHLEFKNGVYRVKFRDKPYRVDSATEFYKLMRDAFPYKVFHTEYHTVRIEFGRARSDHPIYDEADELKTPDKPKEDVEEYKSVEMHPLSLVGEIFSYNQQIFEDDPNADGPSGGLFWTTLDLKNGRPAEILDFVELESLAAALRNDPKLKTIKGWPPMESKKKTLDDDQTVDFLKTKIIGKDTLDFAFYDYDSKADVLTLKLLATPKSLPISNESFILTLKVKPTFVFRKTLHRQNANTGFFMKDPVVL